MWLRGKMIHYEKKRNKIQKKKKWEDRIGGDEEDRQKNAMIENRQNKLKVMNFLAY